MKKYLLILPIIIILAGCVFSINFLSKTIALAQFPSFEIYPLNGTPYPTVTNVNVSVPVDNVVTITANAADISGVLSATAVIKDSSGNERDTKSMDLVSGSLYVAAIDIVNYLDGVYTVDIIAVDYLFNSSLYYDNDGNLVSAYADVGSFTIGSSILIPQFAYLDPESDAVNDGWRANHSLYDAINEGSFDTVNINGDPIGRSNGKTATLDVDMATSTIGENVTQIDVYVYINGMQQSTVYASIYVDGAWQTHQQIFAANDFEEPRQLSTTFSGSWDQADIDNLRVRLEATANEGYQGGAYIDDIYVGLIPGPYLNPDGDIANTKWRWSGDQGPTTDLYKMLDDKIRYNESPDYWGSIRALGDRIHTYNMDMTSVPGISGTTEIKAWVYVELYRNANLYVGIPGQTPVKIVDSAEYSPGESFVSGWRSATFAGSWDQSYLDNLEVELSASVDDGGIGVTAVYAEIFYTGAMLPGGVSVTDARIAPDPAGDSDVLICNFIIVNSNPVYDLTADVAWYRSQNGGQSWSHYAADDETDIPAASGVLASTSILGNIEPVDTALGDSWKCEITGKDDSGATDVMQSEPVIIRAP